MNAESDRLRTLVRDGYDRGSHVYRGDTFDDPRSGYAHWLKRLGRCVPAGARVLDLGCGNGVPVSRELAKRYAVTGVDLSPVMIERARGLVPAAKFQCADMTSVELADRSFDAVAAFFSIFHVPLDEQPTLLARIERWLVPGGCFLAIVGRCAWTGTEPNWRGVPGVTMYYSQTDVATYRDWFGKAGFEILEEGVEPKRGHPGYSVLLARKRGARRHAL